MKTKIAKTKIAKVPATVLPELEPTDSELQAIEQSGEAAPTNSLAPAEIASGQIKLAQLGLNQIAYVRRTVVDDAPAWAIYSAMGHPLGAAPTLEQAWGAIMQNNLQPVHVH
jgi:hypothetical protein